MVEDSGSVKELRQVLSAFNAGYANRDLAALDDFMNVFLPDKRVEFIATGGRSPGHGTWRVGEEAVRDLVRSDWEYWGLIQIDEENARINILNDVAWLSAPATVITDDETEEFLGDREEVKGIVCHVPISDTRAKSLRMTATLVKKDDQWRFAQIHLSFSIRSMPK